jgi:hypothetical protein
VRATALADTDEQEAATLQLLPGQQLDGVGSDVNAAGIQVAVVMASMLSTACLL